MLKRNPRLSRNARNLYMTMRSIADGKTGELRIPGRRWGQAEDRWLKAAAIESAAEMCRNVRLRSMHELIALGFVSMRRERVERIIDGRRRVVLGVCHYIVHKHPVVPKNVEKPPNLLKSLSCTEQKKDSQYLSKTPCGASGSPSGGVRFEGGMHFAGATSSSSPKQLDEEDARFKPSFQPETNINPDPETKIPVDERPKPKQKKIDPALRAWMDIRILNRAGEEVRSRSAYLRAARPGFLEILAEEVEMYLTEQAEEFLQKKIDAKQLPVSWTDIFNVLQAESRKHALPISKGVFVRAASSAAEMLGLEEC